jgi:LysM repeat protein
MPGGKPAGLFIHSTGADNPHVRRYAGNVTGSDPLIGNNPNGNGFTQWTDESGRNRAGQAVPCPNAVMGLATDLKPITVLIMNDEDCPWCAGRGNLATAQRNGFNTDSANWVSYWQVEICEDQRQVTVYGVRNPFNPAQYAKLMYDETVNFAIDFFIAYFDGKPSAVTNRTLLGHADANRLGIASGHADPWHWWNKHGYTLNGFIADVQRGLRNNQPAPTPTPQPTPTPIPTPAPSNSTIINGSIVTITPGARYGGLSTSRGKAVPASQFAPKRHTVADIRTHSGVREARLREINSWVAVSSLSLVGGTPAPNPQTIHTVVRGDTMSGIAQRYGVTLNALRAANPQITNINVINVGQRINIPR